MHYTVVFCEAMIPLKKSSSEEMLRMRHYFNVKIIILPTYPVLLPSLVETTNCMIVF